MIDPRLLKEDFDATAQALARRGYARADLEGLRDLDERRRTLIVAVDSARAEQAAASKAIGRAAVEDRAAMIQAAQELKDELAEKEEQLSAVTDEHADAFARVPNLPHPDAPDGD